MKNVKDYQLKKCIFMETEEFNRIIKTVFGNEFETDFGLEGMSVWSKAEGLSEKEINEGLSEYFDITVTSVHVDDFDDMGVWICYIEKEYPHPRYTDKEIFNMSKFVIEGKLWHAGDNIYIETEEKGMNELPTEVCLNEFIKDNIAEESEIAIVIESKRTMKE